MRRPLAFSPAEDPGVSSEFLRERKGDGWHAELGRKSSLRNYVAGGFVRCGLRRLVVWRGTSAGTCDWTNVFFFDGAASCFAVDLQIHPEACGAQLGW